MAMRRRLEAALHDPALERAWDECFASWGDADDDARDRVRRWVAALRDQLVAMASEVGDCAELEVSIAMRYIELKSHWMTANTWIQYAVQRRGRADGEMVYRAAVVSLLLGAIEPLLRSDDLDEISRFLASPLGRGARE
jgi:hypothetical protein